MSVPVLSNDTDPDGDPLAVLTSTAPANGTAACTASACTYTPAAGFLGTDTFTYTVADGFGGTDTATVTVTVTAAPDAPPQPADDAASTPAGSPISIAPLANDTDPDGDPLAVSTWTQPASGTVACSASTCVYTPNTGFVGTDSFGYTVDDGRGGTASATVVVTVTPSGAPPPVGATADLTVDIIGPPRYRPGRQRLLHGDGHERRSRSRRRDGRDGHAPARAPRLRLDRDRRRRPVHRARAAADLLARHDRGRRHAPDHARGRARFRWLVRRRCERRLQRLRSADRRTTRPPGRSAARSPCTSPTPTPTPPPPPTRLLLSKRASPTVVAQGGRVQYVLRLRNAGNVASQQCRAVRPAVPARSLRLRARRRLPQRPRLLDDPDARSTRDGLRAGHRAHRRRSSRRRARRARGRAGGQRPEGGPRRRPPADPRPARERAPPEASRDDRPPPRGSAGAWHARGRRGAEPRAEPGRWRSHREDRRRLGRSQRTRRRPRRVACRRPRPVERRPARPARARVTTRRSGPNVAARGAARSGRTGRAAGFPPTAPSSRAGTGGSTSRPGGGSSRSTSTAGSSGRPAPSSARPARRRRTGSSRSTTPSSSRIRTASSAPGRSTSRPSRTRSTTTAAGRPHRHPRSLRRQPARPARDGPLPRLRASRQRRHPLAGTAGCRAGRPCGSARPRRPRASGAPRSPEARGRSRPRAARSPRASRRGTRRRRRGRSARARRG